MFGNRLIDDLAVLIFCINQALNLLDDLKTDLGLSYLFIAHNLAVVEHFCDRVAVMYLGRIVENAGRDELYAEARHPYTQALLSAAPHPETLRRRNRIVMPGEVPSPMNPPSGCAFHPRCYLTRELAQEAGNNAADTVRIETAEETTNVMKRCVAERPELEASDKDPTHCAACWFSKEAVERGGPKLK